MTPSRSSIIGLLANTFMVMRWRLLKLSTMISLVILARRATTDVVWGCFFFFWKRLNLLLPFPLPHRATRKGLVYELLLWFMFYCSDCLCFRIASNFLCICMNLYYFGWFRNLSPCPHIQFQKSIKRKFTNKFTNPLVPTSNFRIASNCKTSKCMNTVIRHYTNSVISNSVNSVKARDHIFTLK